MSYLGDFAAGDTIDFKFTTRRFSTGAPYTLGGTPAVSIYKSNSTTQSTSGITLTVDFDSVTGLNHVRVDTTSDGTFYADGGQFNAVITAGTVDSVSVVGETVGRFTLRAQAALYPTTAGRKLDVSAAGNAGIDWSNIENPSTAVDLSGTTLKGVRSNTLAAGSTGTTAVLDASASATDDFYNGGWLWITSGSGAGQVRLIKDYVGSTKTCTVDAWVTTPGEHNYIILPSNTVNANVTQFGGTNGTFASGRPEVNATHWAGTTITATSIPVATAAGTSGGLLIAGSNAPTTFTGSGSTAGLTITGGSTATGALRITGGSTSGAGVHVTTTSGNGLTISGSGGSGCGISVTGGLYGFYATSSAFGIAFCIEGGTDGSGLVVSAPQGSSILATGDQPGLLISTTSTDPNYAGLNLSGGGVGGRGLYIFGEGSGVVIETTSSTGYAMELNGFGTNAGGLKITATGTGQGIDIDTGTGDGVNIENSFTVQTNGIPWNAAWDAEVQSEVQDAIEANNLDHLVKIAVDTDFATTVHLNSVIGHLADNGTSATFDRTTDSLEAIYNSIDAIPTTTEIATDVWGEAQEGGYTARQIHELNGAVLWGILSGMDTGAATFKGLDGTTTRVAATVDSYGNRSGFTVTPRAV